MNIYENDRRYYELVKIAGEIIERNLVINNYVTSRYLDRNHTIQMISDLQSTDWFVVMTTRMRQRLSYDNVPLWMCRSDVLIQELQWQLAVLEVEYILIVSGMI